MEVTLPFARMGADDDQPMLRLITICFFMAGILLIPAGIEAARRGGQAVRTFFAAGGVRRRSGCPCRDQAAWDPSCREHHCPLCGEDADACKCQWPFCQHPSLDVHGLPLDEKLHLALTHPARENRMLAIELLGELRNPSALVAFRKLLATERDPHAVVEVARATARIGGDEATRILAGLKSHESAMVREVAGRLWGETVDEGRRRETGLDVK